MLKRLLFALLLIALPEWAGASTWYFSDCATGGDGTSTNPFCLRPPNSSTTNYATNISIDTLFDTTSTTGGCYTPPCTNGLQEAKTGDVIYLCCGDVDGCGDATTSCTYNVAASSTPSFGSSWFTPDLSGSFQIRNYGGDTPTISGDTNGDGVANDNLQVGIWQNNVQGYTVSGINLVRFSKAGIAEENTTSSGVGWNYDRVTVDEIGNSTWGDTDGLGNNTGCNHLQDSTATYGVYLWGVNYNFTFLNGTIKRVCGFAIRNISHMSPGHTANHTTRFENTTFENIIQTANIWGNWDYKLGTGETFIFRNNTVTGWGGSLGFEQQNFGAVIENNTFYCTDAYNMTQNAYGNTRCEAAIDINGGDFSARRGSNAGHRIVGNVFIGARQVGDSASANGWMSAGVVWQDSCRSSAICTGMGTPWCCCTGVGQGVCNSTTSFASCPTNETTPDARYGCTYGAQYNNTIENNMFVNVVSRTGISDQVGLAPIGVNSNQSVIVRNNTVLGGRYHSLYLDDGVTDLGTGFPIFGNIFSSAATSEVYLGSSTVLATLTGNNIYSANTSDSRYVRSGGFDYDCTELSSINSDGENSGNVCAVAPVFVATSGAPSTWDLHTNATGPDYNILASGPLTDIDYDPRPFDPTGISPTPYDRGADEVRPSGLFIEWGQTTSTSGDQHCGPFGSPDDNTTFRPFYHNYGPGDATNVKLYFTWSPDADFVSTTCPSCVNAGDLLTCTVGTVPALGGAQCNVVLVCPSIAARHGLQIWSDISSDNRGVCATDETINTCANFPSPAATQGLP